MPCLFVCAAGIPARGRARNSSHRRPPARVGVWRRFGDQDRAQFMLAKVRRLRDGAPERIFDEEHARFRVRQQLQMLVGGELVIERHDHAAGKKNSVGGDQPLRLIRHDDRGAVAGGKARIFERRSQRLGGFAKLPVGQARTFALAVGLDQADFIRPAVQRIAQAPRQAIRIVSNPA